MGENVEKGVDEEKVGENPKRSGGYGGEMAGNSARDQHARIDIRIDGVMSNKNQTHTIEMSDMWAD